MKGLLLITILSWTSVIKLSDKFSVLYNINLDYCHLIG